MKRKKPSNGGITRRQVLKYGFYGGLAAGLGPSLWLSGCGRKGVGRRPNIILLTVDTLRADHMGLYGYHRNTMPVIEDFARGAVVFEDAVVSRSSTCPSYASMLTGLYPFHHGVYNNGPVLHDKLVTLPEVLRSAGYHTAGFVSNFVLLDDMCGFGQGFDVYDDRVEDREVNRPNYERGAGGTVKTILEWLETAPKEPFFLFTNFIDPHGPYRPPERFKNLYKSGKKRILKHEQIPPYQRLGESLNYYDYVDGYDAEIRYVDEAMGVLIEQLKKSGLWEDSLVVFTADHGESLGEHNIFFEHQYHLFEEVIRVPLAIRLPRRDRGGFIGPGRVGSLASPMDLMPTILDYLGLGHKGLMDGRSLLDILRGREDTERSIFVEFPQHSIPRSTDPDIYAVRTATHKLIRIMEEKTSGVNEQVVFDISRDRLESEPIIYNGQIKLHRKLSKLLDSMIAEAQDYELPFTLVSYEMPLREREGFVEQRKGAGKKIIKPLSDDQIERLRSLGYVK